MMNAKIDKNIKVVAVSGGFDPVHIGHVRMFEKAKRLGTHLVVILNGDEWLKNKKGYSFMPEDERAELIKKFGVVDDVYIHREIDEHTSVTGALRDYTMLIDGQEYPINIFANGGDRKDIDDIPEGKICKEKGIEMIFEVGKGGKVQSSSWLIDAVRNKFELDIRPWGHMHILDSKDDFWVKSITVAPEKRLSLQSHKDRRELWACIDGEVFAERGVKTDDGFDITEKIALKPGDTFYVQKEEIHRLSSEKGGTIIEVAFDAPKEEDNTRWEDDHGRA
jgi:D-beta-D-heptose 7-phosphate kinase/D-beta-D-heptose 1-phosphate adenosyltransferase